MSEQEKGQEKDIELKKFEEEVEGAIDQLFVPASSGDGEDQAEDIQPEAVEEDKPAPEKDQQGSSESKNEIDVPNLESSIDAAIDELFVDVTARKGETPAEGEVEVEPVERASVSSDAQVTETEREPHGVDETVASEQQIRSEVIDSLKEKLLSLDWEISATNIKAMEKALSGLPPEVTEDAKVVSTVRMMQAVLKYLATVRYSASPLSIQFLRDAMDALERFLLGTDMTEEKAKSVIGELVSKFKRLKHEAKKYQKVKLKKVEKAPTVPEVTPLPLEIIPDALKQTERLEENLKSLSAYSKKIEICVRRVKNLLSRYERLHDVFQRKPSLAKVTNYFGETTTGMVQEIDHIKDILASLSQVFQESEEVIKIHKEILEKQKVAEPEASEALEERKEEIKQAESVEAEQGTVEEIESEKTLVVPVTQDIEEEVEPQEAEQEVGEEETAEVEVAPAEEEKQEGTPAEDYAKIEEVEDREEEESTSESGEIPEIDVAAEAEEEKEEKEEEADVPAPELPSESAYDPVYLVTIGGQVLAIPSQFVANIYSLSEKKINLISSKGYAFLKDLKPFFRSIKHGMFGPLSQKSSKELKNIKVDVVEPELSRSASGEDAPKRYKGLVLLSDGERTVLVRTDENVSRRPTPVTSYETNHLEAGLTGRVEIEGQFNVPVLNVEELLSQSQ